MFASASSVAAAPAASEPFARAADGPPSVAVTADMAAVEAEWRAFEATAAGSPYQRFDVVDAWHRHLGRREGAAPLVVTVRTAGRLALLLPLSVHRRGPVRIARFPGGSHCNHNTGLIDPSLVATPPDTLLAAIASAVADSGAGVDLLHLGYQPAEIGGRPNPLVGPGAERAMHDAYDMALDGGFDAVLGRHKGSKKRSKVRAHAKVFEEVGGYRVTRETSPESAAEALRAFLSQKAERLAALGLPNVFAAPGTDAFFQDLLDRHFAGAGGLVDVYTLRHDEGIGATGICLPFAGTEHFLMSSFALDRFARGGPGELALHHMLEDCSARGVARFDFGIGDARYKRSWCDREVVMMDTVLPLTALGGMAAASVRAMKQVKARIRANPALHRLAQSVRSRLGGRPAASETASEAADD